MAGGLFPGYGGKTTLGTEARDKSYLAGIGQSKDDVTGIEGATAQQAYDRYAASGASEAQLKAFTERMAEKYR